MVWENNGFWIHFKRLEKGRISWPEVLEEETMDLTLDDFENLIKAPGINQKYTNAMPLYRQEQEFKRYDIQLTRQDLSNWTLKGAVFVYDTLKENQECS